MNLFFTGKTDLLAAPNQFMVYRVDKVWAGLTHSQPQVGHVRWNIHVISYDLDSAFNLAIPYILLFDKYPYWADILRYDIWHYTIYVTKTPSTIRYQGPTVFSVFRIIIMVLFRVSFLLIVTSLLSGNIKHYGSCNPFCYKLIFRSSSVKQ